MKYRNLQNKGGNFDIVSAINKITPNNIEFHLIDQADDGTIKKANFTGPNTNLKDRLYDYNEENGTYSKIKDNSIPINKLDRGALEHDLAYTKYKDLPNRLNADRKLITITDEILNDKQSTNIQKFNAQLVKIILLGKIKFGVGICKEIIYEDIDTDDDEDNEECINEHIEKINNVCLCGHLFKNIKIQDGGNIDTNLLIREAQQISKTPEFQGNDPTRLIIGLIGLAGAIGIPAIIKLINKKKKENI
jgi:hypothetical protein